MSDENKLEKKEVAKAASKPVRRCIGVLLKTFSHSEAICPQYWHKSVKSWNRGQVIWSEQEINQLVALNAPIEVFYQDVNGTAKG